VRKHELFQQFRIKLKVYNSTKFSQL